jgi:hypothetical protein
MHLVRESPSDGAASSNGGGAVDQSQLETTQGG